MALEPFIKDNLSWVNLFKWRATWGRTGNANTAYFIGKQYFDANFFQGYPWNSGSLNGIQEYPVPNPNVTWEKADKLNVGLDIALFNGHLRATAEYFRNEYFDLMQQRSEEHTSELQSLMRTSYAVFCLKKKKIQNKR